MSSSFSPQPKALWFLFIPLIPVALWYRMRWQSTQHPLIIKVKTSTYTDAQRAEFGKTFIWNTGVESPFPDNFVRVQLVDAKKLPKGRYLEGPRVSMHITQAEERESPTGAWQSRSTRDWNVENNLACSPESSVLSRQPRNPSGQQASASFSAPLLCGPNVGRLQQVKPYSEWRVKGSIEVLFFSPDTAEEWRGSLPLDANFIFRRAYSSLAEVNPVDFDPNKDGELIASLEYTFSAAGPWRPAPAPGQPGYPLKAPANSTIGFRAVKADPNRPWPTRPQVLPIWDRKFGEKKREDSGENLWVYMDTASRNAEDLLKISVTAGNHFDTAVLITPEKNAQP